MQISWIQLYLYHKYPDDHTLRGVVESRDETEEEEEEVEAYRKLEQDSDEDSDEETFSSEDEA